MALDLHRLQFLREVAARGTMTAAAESLAYTTSAISQGIAALERDLGTALVEKQGRRVVLTPAGRALVSEADAVFAAAARAETAVHQAAGTITGPVHVGAFQSAGARLVPIAFRSLLRAHPDLELHFRQFEFEGRRELTLGRLDVHLDQEYELVPHDRHRGFEVTTILAEPVYLAVPEGTDRGPDLAVYAERSWAVAANEATDDHAAVRAICRRAGFEPDVRFHTDDLEVILQLVASGLACGFLARLATYRVPEGVRLHRMDDSERRVKALVRPEVADRPAIRLVLEHFVAAASAV
jgi:DNA-binding transcriptional LysR family regulator